MDKIEKLASATKIEFIKALVQVIEKEGFIDVKVVYAANSHIL